MHKKCSDFWTPSSTCPHSLTDVCYVQYSPNLGFFSAFGDPLPSPYHRGRHMCICSLTSYNKGQWAYHERAEHFSLQFIRPLVLRARRLCDDDRRLFFKCFFSPSLPFLSPPLISSPKFQRKVNCTLLPLSSLRELNFTVCCLPLNHPSTHRRLILMTALCHMMEHFIISFFFGGKHVDYSTHGFCMCSQIITDHIDQT